MGLIVFNILCKFNREYFFFYFFVCGCCLDSWSFYIELFVYRWVGLRFDRYLR